MNLEMYDFRRPGRLTSDIEHRVAAWLRTALALLPAKWGKHLPIPLQLSLQGTSTAGLHDALAQLPDAVVCHCLELGDASAKSLLSFPRNLTLGLLSGVMGDPVKELPADRLLTPVEESLWNFLLQQLVQVLLETWPGDEALKIAIGASVPQPKRSKLLSPETALLAFAFGMSGPFGDAKWVWLVPQQELIVRLTQSGQDAGKPQQQRQAIEVLVREMPVEVAVRLGTTELPVSELTRLRAGDVVILDQRVSDPLAAQVSGQTRFRVWPGRVGARRAFQIDSMVEL